MPLQETRFANNEHLLCSLLAKQLILVRDWLDATVRAVCLFCSEGYSRKSCRPGFFYSSLIIANLVYTVINCIAMQRSHFRT